MARILVVGAGRVGLALIKIANTLKIGEIYVVDTLPAAIESVKQYSKDIKTFVASSKEELEQCFDIVRPKVVVCSTPFNINTTVAQIAASRAVDYVDFTEDNQVTEFISSLDVSSTFVPQTGLAPGLVSYIGLDLFSNLGTPHSLDLRVGALPRVAFGPDYYAITWSPEGLINEYIKPAKRKRNGALQVVDPLIEREELLVDGIIYEGFTTSGGVGDLAAYPHIPNVEYKTLRHQGHLENTIKPLLKNFLNNENFSFEEAVEDAKKKFPTTRDDTVVLAAVAKDVNGKMASAGIHFLPEEELGLTALELTTSGTGVAVIELLLEGKLNKGILKPSDIPYGELKKTAAYSFVFKNTRGNQ